MFPVEFDDQLPGEAHGIDRVRPYRMLAAKLEAVQAPVAQHLPEQPFRLRLFAAKAARKFVGHDYPSPCSRLATLASLSPKGRGILGQ